MAAVILLLATNSAFQGGKLAPGMTQILQELVEPTAELFSA
jgi:hypothetical protein